MSRFFLVMNLKSMRGRHIEFLLAALTLMLLGSEAGVVLWWWQQPEQYEALTIEAPHDILTAGHPVYAQFVFRQRVVLEDYYRVVALRLPLARVLGSSEVVDVALEQEGKIVAQWRAQEVPIGIHEIEFLLLESVEMRGPLDIVIAAPGTTPDEQEDAVRVFVELADYHYPDGNYQVAGHEKSGDIGLALIAERTHGQVVGQRWRQRPAEVTARLLVFVALAMVVGGLPYLFWPQQKREA